MRKQHVVCDLDVPIEKLVPRHERKVNNKHYQRIAASLRAVGLLEPLVVYALADHYEILDGCIRYRILLELGVKTVPCILWPEREGFTAMRMVNHVSVAEEIRMLRQSLQELDEKTIANALGLAGIQHRLYQGLLRRLAAEVVQLFEAGKLSRRVAEELGHVQPPRQREIVDLMHSCHDYSLTFAKGLILNTPTAKRAKLKNNSKTPWHQTEKKKGDLLKRLQEVEQQKDFFLKFYRQYTTNLLQLVIYVRSWINNPQVKEYLEDHDPQQLALFTQIIQDGNQ